MPLPQGINDDQKQPCWTLVNPTKVILVAPNTLQFMDNSITLHFCDLKWLHDRKRMRKCCWAFANTNRVPHPVHSLFWTHTSYACIQGTNPFFDWLVHLFTRMKRATKLNWCIRRENWCIFGSKRILPGANWICFYHSNRNNKETPLFFFWLWFGLNDHWQWFVCNDVDEKCTIQKLIQDFRSTFPKGGRTLSIKIQDDQGHIHDFVIQYAIYMPTSLANLFCPQQWAMQCKCDMGDTVTHCDMTGNHLIMEWLDDQVMTVYSKQVLIAGLNVGITATVPGYLWFCCWSKLSAPIQWFGYQWQQ